VYATGEEPDYRFRLANERTFLAWIRTALDLLAGAVAFEVLDPELPDAARRLPGDLLVASGTLAAASAWLRWAAAERPPSGRLGGESPFRRSAWVWLSP
jgi:putative membrane protein